MPAQPLPAEDLAHILAHAPQAFAALANANLFITGGTGFFGHSLLESLLYANHALHLNLHATVLTRNAENFQARSPHIASDPAVTLLEGDVRTFVFPPQPHTHIVHAATDSGGQQANQTLEALAKSILSGTQHVLNFAQATGAARLLYTSTGAVYGRSTPLLHTPETYLNTHSPELPPHSYEAAKRQAELLCLAHPNLQHIPASPLQVVIARCFAFVGPHLPLDQHFAIGNFIGSALANQAIHIKGDGTPRRSWLYTADLAIWLWTLLTQSQPNRAYNVGSDQGYTIAEAAQLVRQVVVPSPNCHPEAQPKDLRLSVGDSIHTGVQIDGTPNPSAPLNSYVPDITCARTELGLLVRIPIDEAIRRTAAWHQGTDS